MSEPASGALTPEDLLKDSMGNFGCYQFFIIFLIYLHRFPVGFHQLIIILHAPPPGNFTCSNTSMGQCDENCPSHDFDHKVWEKTTVHEWDLVCNKTYLISVTQMFAMLGILFGNIIFGYLGDKFGRIIPLASAATLQLVAGVATGFAPWLWLYILGRFLTAFATGGTMVPSFALLMEFTAKRWRTFIGIWFTIPVHLAHSLLGVVGYFWRRWDYDQIAVSAYSTLLLTYWFFLPESPRWLLQMKKQERVVNILERGAKCNRRPIDNIRPQMEKYIAQQEKANAGAPPKQAGNFTDLFRTTRMRTKTIIMCLNWFSTALAFYAIAQYVGTVGGDIFLNTIIAGLMQIPANILGSVLVGVIGRKWTVIGSYLVIAVPMLIVAFLPVEPYWPITALSILGQCGSAISFSLMYVYSGELFPTMLRSIGMGLCSMIGRLGSMIAPYIMLLQLTSRCLPPILFAVFPILSAVITLIFLPETMDIPLVDTVEEADKV